MKIEELQIGDWINVFGVPKQVEGVRKFKNGDEVVYHDGDNGNFIKSVTPIPLTPEILEKNGFYNSDLVDDYFIVHGIHYNVDSKYIMFGYEYVNVLEVRCEYVHELQHALKLCGIDKEIVL